MDRPATAEAVARTAGPDVRLDWADARTLRLHAPPGGKVAVGAPGAPSQDGTGQVVPEVVTFERPPENTFTRYRPADLLAGRRLLAGQWRYRAWRDGFHLAPDGESALFYTADGMASGGPAPRLVHLPTGKVTPMPDPNEGGKPYRYAGWLPDGRLLLVGRKVWLGGPRGEGLREIAAASGIMLAQPSPTGRYLALWGRPGLQVLDLQTAELRTIQADFRQGASFERNSVSWSPDGTLLTGTDFGPDDGTTIRTRIVDVATGVPVRTIEGAGVVAWSAAGSLLAWRPGYSPYAQGTLLFLALDGAEKVLSAIEARVSPDGKFMLLREPGKDWWSLLETATGTSISLDFPGQPAWTDQGELLFIEIQPCSG
jgi:hypothetical protein